ncbi:MAG: 7-cyano-7-deazaguanine reductase [SAR86 cluster bacterium]|uniref:7-cyano-7-deazaguanine reductase n=1 Tax=SAR86 cluster bacterium TaxID=2030880 RepID=A0A520LRT7_9GAMM|nr:MAG: 7-cyano-7-deazaguanine reductase [SAR86 cluster bacterium]
MKIKYLGQQSTPKLDSYSPDFLDSIPRHNQHLNKFFGLDYWNAYEFSYLNSKNLPVIEALEIKIPMHSAFTVESKSLKLYLASFYNKKFNNSTRAYKLIEGDLSKLLNSQVSVRKLNRFDDAPSSTLVSRFNNKVPKNKVIHFQGFRSICPVTSQPDWGNVYIHSMSNPMDSKKLIKFLKSYRNKGDFHEACIESIFISLRDDFKIDDLTVYGKFLRRGGIDINPIRSTSKKLIFKNFRDFSQ